MDTPAPGGDGGHLFAETSKHPLPVERRPDVGGVGGEDADSPHQRAVKTWMYCSVLMINWFHWRCRDEKHVIPFQNGEQTSGAGR